MQLKMQVKSVSEQGNVHLELLESDEPAITTASMDFVQSDGELPTVDQVIDVEIALDEDDE